MPDITPGYTFTSGDTVTHTKLNSAAGGSIDGSFYTGKGTLASYSASNCTVLVYDSATNSYKRGTLANVFFNSDELIKNRSASTTPSDTYIFLCQDPSGGMYKVTRANLFYQMFSVTGLLDAASGLTSTSGWGLKVNADGTSLEIATNVLKVKDGGITSGKLAAKACTPAKIQGVYDSGWITSTATLIAAGSATHAHGLAALPGEVSVWLQIGVTQNGWTAGDVVSFNTLAQNIPSSYPAPYVGADTTNIYLCTSAGVYLPHKTTGATVLLTDAGSLNRIRIVARLTEQTGV